MGLKPRGWGEGGDSKGLQGSGIFLPRGPRLPTLREWGRERGISLGTLGFPPPHRSEGFWGDRGSATHPYTQEVPPVPPGQLNALTAPPPTSRESGQLSPREGRSGRAGGGALEAWPWHQGEEIPGCLQGHPS